jgi:citrate lyase subunit beta/citryl-CoA lyase
MLDLEDGVAPERKDDARAAVLGLLEQVAAAPVYVRINDASTAEGAHDLDAIASGAERIAAVVVPKADRAAVDRASAATDLPLVALVETASGLEEVASVARMSRIAGVMFGCVDYVADVSRHGGWHFSDLAWAESRLINASAAAGCWALAGPHIRLDDRDGLRSDVAGDRARGFAGKLCIHPDQLEDVNSAFSPRAEDLAWAQRVVAATGSVDGGAVRLDGQMIDRPLIEQAARLVKAARGTGR